MAARSEVYFNRLTQDFLIIPDCDDPDTSSWVTLAQQFSLTETT